MVPLIRRFVLCSRSHLIPLLFSLLILFVPSTLFASFSFDPKYFVGSDTVTAYTISRTESGPAFHPHVVTRCWPSEEPGQSSNKLAEKRKMTRLRAEPFEQYLYTPTKRIVSRQRLIRDLKRAGDPEHPWCAYLLLDHYLKTGDTNQIAHTYRHLQTSFGRDEYPVSEGNPTFGWKAWLLMKGHYWPVEKWYGSDTLPKKNVKELLRVVRRTIPSAEDQKIHASMLFTQAQLLAMLGDRQSALRIAEEFLQQYSDISVGLGMYERLFEAETVKAFANSLEPGRYDLKSETTVKLKTFRARHASIESEATKVLQKLRETPIKNHASIYRKILNDTSLLNHPAVREEIVRLAKEVWFKKFIKGHSLQELNLTDERIEFESVKRFTDQVFGRYRKLALHLDGDPFIEVWLNISPRSGLDIPDIVVQRFKRNGKRVIQKLLSRISFSAKKDQDRFTNRRIFSGSTNPFSRVLYEIVRENWGAFNPGFQKRIRKFAMNALEAKTTTIPFLKRFSVAFLLDRGISEETLRNRIVQPPLEPDEGPEIIEFYINSIFEDAQKWRSEYPKWPKGSDPLVESPLDRIPG